MRQYTILCFILTACATLFADAFPKTTYERLKYELSWGPFTVGYATFTAEQINQEWKLDLHVQTTDWADTFYTVNTHMHSKVADSWERILAHTKRQQEGGTDRDIKLILNEENQTITYTNFGRPEPSIDWVDGVLDPLSALYKARRDFLKGKGIQTLTITDGKKNFEMPFDINFEEDEISTPYGDYEKTLLISPSTEDIGGVFKKSKNARLEVFLDPETGRPIMLKSKVRVGSFKAKLMEVEVR